MVREVHAVVPRHALVSFCYQCIPPRAGLSVCLRPPARAGRIAMRAERTPYRRRRAYLLLPVRNATYSAR